MTEDIGRVPSEPGSRPAGQAPSGLDASRFDPSRECVATIVIGGPSAKAISPVLQAVQELAPFSMEEGAVRMTAFSFERDAMSVLDAVEALVYSRALDPYERIDCLKELVQLGTWEQCLAKFTEWDLEYRDGDLIDLSDSDRYPEGDETPKSGSVGEADRARAEGIAQGQPS